MAVSHAQDAMTTVGKGFVSGQARARWVIGCLVVTIGLYLVTVLALFSQIDLLSRVAAGQTITRAAAAANDHRLQTLWMVQVLVYIFTGALFLLWLWRAHRNLPALGARGLQYAPGWAVGGFFVPGLCLLRPFQVVREIWHASDPHRTDATSCHHMTTPALVGWWWAMFLLTNLMYYIAGPLATSAGANVNMLITTSWWLVATEGCAAVGAILAAWLVWEIDQRQTATAQRLLTPPAPLGPPAPSTACSVLMLIGGLAVTSLLWPQGSLAAMARQFAYDEAGRLTRMVDTAGRTTTMQWEGQSDGVEHLTRTLPDGSQVTYAFDQHQRRIAMHDALGTVSYTYDGGRLVRVHREGQPVITYTYDTQDLITTLRVGQQYTMQYTYDFLGRLAAMDTAAGRITYDYATGQGLVIRTLPNGIKTVWAFHPDQSLASITHVTRDGHILLQFTYTYHPDGLISQVKTLSPQEDKTVTYTYDTAQRLTSVNEAQNGTTSYHYTMLGDTAAVRTADALPAQNTYDWAGRLLTHADQPCTHDAAGNLTACGTAFNGRALEYDTANRLAVVTTAQGEGRYRYDGDGALVERTVAGQTTVYVPTPLATAWSPLIATDETGRATAFLWDGETVLASITGEEVRFMLHDHLGSVRGVVDQVGTLLTLVDYTPFGQPRQSVQSPQLVPGFAGLFFDPTAAVYLTQARAYDPALGRFLQMEPEVRVPYGSQNDLSPYVYCGNDPVNYRDVSGRDRVPVHPRVIDWTQQLRDMERHAQAELGRKLIDELDADVQRLTDKVIDTVFKDQKLLNQLAHDVVDAARHTPLDQPLNLVPIVVRRLRQAAESRLRAALDKVLKPKFGPYVAIQHGTMPEGMAYTLPGEVPTNAREMWRYLRKAFTDTVIDYAARSLQAHTGKLDIFGGLKKPGSYTHTQVLKDLNTVFGKFVENRTALAQVFRDQIRHAHMTLPVPSVPGEALRVGSQVFGTFVDGMTTGLKAVDLIGSSMQAMNAPVNLQQRQVWGWEGHTRRTLAGGGTYRRDTQLITFDLPDVARLRGTITQLDRQRVTTAYGTLERRTLTSTRAMHLPERLMMYVYPVQDYYDPQATRSITTTTGRMRYRETTSGGVRTITPIPSQEPLQPVNVGGVYLHGASAALAHLGPLSGIALDVTNGRLVLLSEEHGPLSLPPLRLDDVVTVFRIVYQQGRAPSVSIDPDPANPRGPIMHVRLEPASLRDTYVGWVLFEADRLAKVYSLGRDNVTGAVITSQVPCYRHLLDPAFLGIADKSIWERFWIVPASVQRQQSSDRHLSLFAVPLKVNTERMAMRQGKLVTAANPTPSLGAKTVAAWFTEHYDAIAQEALLLPPTESGITTPVSVLAELRRIALITAIAETLRDQGVPFPVWMRDYQVQPVPVTATTPSMVVTSASQPAATPVPQCTPRTARQTTWIRQIYGGVDLTPAARDLHTTIAAPHAEAMAPKVAQTISTEPVFSPVRIQHDEASYQAVALPGNATRAVGGQRLEETDLVVPVQRDSQIALVRHFHSFFQPPDVFGGSWTFDLPQLDQQRQPVKRTQKAVHYHMVYQLSSPLHTWSARFAKHQRVPELNGEFLVPDRPGAILALVGENDKRLGQKTQAVLFRDGRRWHFDDAGRMVAWSTAPLLVVYRRDTAGRIQRIEGWYGEQQHAHITLAYDSQGRLTSATGSDGAQVTYRYDDTGALRHVARPDGLVGYAYQEKLVSAITHDGHPVKSFVYNAQGQLQREQFADGTTVAYTSRLTPQGMEISASRDGQAQPGDTAQYDPAFRPLRRSLDDGTTVEWHRRPNGEVDMPITLPDGSRYVVTQAADGTRREVRLPEGGTYALTFDASGRVTSVQHDGQPVVLQQWRSDGQLAAVTYATVALHPEYRPDGVVTGLLLAAPDQGPRLSRWQRFAYDEQGRVTAVTDYAGTKLQIGYDQSGAPAVLSSTQGQVTITRNNAGAVTDVTTNWGPAQHHTYSGPDGALTAVQLVHGDQHATLALDRSRPTRVQQFDGGVLTASYYTDDSHHGQLREISTPSALRLRYGYDEAHRLAQVEIGEGYRVEYRYDDQDRLVGLTRAPLGQ